MPAYVSAVRETGDPPQWRYEIIDGGEVVHSDGWYDSADEAEAAGMGWASQNGYETEWDQVAMAPPGADDGDGTRVADVVMVCCAVAAVLAALSALFLH